MTHSKKNKDSKLETEEIDNNDIQLPEFTANVEPLNKCNRIDLPSAKFERAKNIVEELCKGNVIVWNIFKQQHKIKRKELDYFMKYGAYSYYENEAENTGQIEVDFKQINNAVCSLDKSLFLVQIPNSEWLIKFNDNPAEVIIRIFKNFANKTQARNLKIWKDGDLRSCGEIWTCPNDRTVRISLVLSQHYLLPTVDFTFQFEITNIDPTTHPELMEMDNIAGIPLGDWQWAVCIERTRIDTTKSDPMLSLKKFFFFKQLSDTHALCCTTCTMIWKFPMPFSVAHRLSNAIMDPENDVLHIRKLIQKDARGELVDSNQLTVTDISP